MFNVALLDADRIEIAKTEKTSLKEAKAAMRYYLSDKYAMTVGSTHGMLGTVKAEVRNEAGEVVADKFLLKPEERRFVKQA